MQIVKTLNNLLALNIVTTIIFNGHDKSLARARSLLSLLILKRKGTYDT